VGGWEETLAPDRAAAYRDGVRLCLQLAEDGSPEGVGRAFLYAERARARSLVERLAQARPGGDGTAAGERLDRLTRLRHEIWWRKSALERTPGRHRRRHRLEREVARLEDELRSGLARLGREHPVHFGLADVLVPSPDEVRASLPPGTALVEWVVGDDDAVCFVIDRSGLRARRVGASRADLLHALRGLQFQMNRFALGRGYARRHRRLMRRSAEAHLAELGRLLLGGLGDEIDARRLVFAPHDVLHYVPFHALVVGGRHLLEEHEVSVVPSASALRWVLRPRRRDRARGALVVGVPSATTPMVEREVEAVARALGGARVLLAAEATWDNLVAAAGSCRYLHIASHGLYRADSPLASAIRLADRWLSFEDVLSLRLRADLVVLSACHAGLDRLLSGDEQLGLGRAVLHAGASSLVTTLWAVEDEAMAWWMGEFYRQLGAGRGPAAALRQASLLAREREPHPYHWAPCVLTGRPGP
jgi:hypothetical protein